jgi:hypothetical protein
MSDKIMDAEDILARACDLIECAASAAAHVWGKEADQVATPLEVASSKIEDAIALLKDYRKAPGADREAA